jgi:DNA-directed RNA polymerase subunit M/transcription elongation factor TFIIS
MIRVKVQIYYVCEDCGYEWVPCKLVGAADIVETLSEECPRCAERYEEQRQLAARLNRHLDPVVNLLG